MKYRAAVFDLDGTLLDTEQGILASVRSVVAEHGEPELDDTTLRTFIGPPIQRSFQRQFALSERDADVWAARFRELYSSENLFLAEPYEGITQLLETLHRSGIALAIATYKRQDYALRLFEHFGLDRYTDAFFGADQEGRLSKADIIELAVASLGVSKAETPMIGDTAHDALGAEDAGVPFLAVTYGFGFASACDVEGYPHVGAAASPEDLLGYFVSEAN